MKIIKYQESYSSVNLRRLALPFAVWLSALGFLVALLFLSLFVPSIQKYWLLLSIFTILLFASSKNHINRLIYQIRTFRFGKRGEDTVVKELSKHLDDSYIYVENYQIPNTRIGDIDGLLIGPKGVIILEVKNYNGVFRISGPDMYRRLRGDIYKLYERSPFEQTIRQKEYLTKFLREKGVDTHVIPTVVLVTGKINAISGETGVFIAEINKLTNHIFEMSQVSQWSPEFSEKTIAALGLKGQK